MKWYFSLCYGLICLLKVGCTYEGRYDKVFRLDQYKCETEYFMQSQYQKSLVVWNGNRFQIWCHKTFSGHNPSNVVTDYTVCFTVLDYHISNCKIKVEYSATHLLHTKLKESFTCNDKFPNQWCTRDIASVKIIADEDSSSYLTIEVTVQADTDLSITACLLIVAGIIVFILLIICVVCVRRCRKSKPSEGRVVRTEGTSRTGMPLVSYPTTVMEPVGRGMYVPRTAVIQVRAQNMPTQRVAPPAARSVTPTAPLNDFSAPPPSYKECV